MATREHDTEHLARLMEKIDIAMLVTVDAQDNLVSRPLSTQCASFDGERVWFLTHRDTPKVEEIERHPKVNLAYASRDANTYLSVAGRALVHRDQALIDDFWNDAMKAFFPEGKDDPDLVLIEVAVDTVEYWDGPGSWIGKALSFAVARVTGNDEAMGENRIVDVASGESREPSSGR
jgi:general stress protein 26